MQIVPRGEMKYMRGEKLCRCEKKITGEIKGTGAKGEKERSRGECKVQIVMRASTECMRVKIKCEGRK